MNISAIEMHIYSQMLCPYKKIGETRDYRILARQLKTQFKERLEYN